MDSPMIIEFFVKIIAIIAIVNIIKFRNQAVGHNFIIMVKAITIMIKLRIIIIIAITAKPV